MMCLKCIKHVLLLCIYFVGKSLFITFKGIRDLPGCKQYFFFCGDEFVAVNSGSIKGLIKILLRLISTITQLFLPTS